MLSSVDISNAQGGFISLPLQDATSGIVVKSIDGLDPVKATMVSSSFTNMDGEQYHSSKRDKRNIVLTLGLDPDFTSMGVRELRQTLYGVMMPKSPIHMTFYDSDGSFVVIDGRVESMVTPLFAQDPEVQISILCFNPDFLDPNPVILSGVSSSNRQETYIKYDGTIETGILLAITPSAIAGSTNSYIRSQGQAVQNCNINVLMAAGSTITISSVPGEKYVYLTNPAGARTSALQGMSPFSAWLTLWPGDNYFLLDYQPSPPIPWEIQYFNRYGGL